MSLDLEKLSKDLEIIVGDNYVFSNIYERIVYADSLLPYDIREEELPDAVVQPANAQEISEILKYANSNKIPVTTYGSGTSLIYATKPKHRGIVLSTERLNSLEINEDYQWLECGAGAKTGQVIKELGKLGYFLPIQTQLGSSMGGAVSINTLGHLTDNLFSRPVSTVLALEVVLPTGEIVNTGSKSIRRASGWDLGRIIIGAEGILGVITKIRMILIPMPLLSDAVAFFKTIEEIGHAMGLMYKKKLPLPMDGEFVDEKILRVGCETYGVDLPGGAMALTKSMGRKKEESDRNAQELISFFKSLGATESYVLEDNETREKLWKIRENGLRWGQEKGLKGYVGIEVNPPLPLLSEAMTELTNSTKTSKGLMRESEAYLYGHIGSDSLHCLYAFPWSFSRQETKQLVEEIWAYESELNIKYDGIGGDWGQLPYRVDFYRKKYGEISYEIIKRIKKAIDPNNILNRGNLEGELI